MAGLAAPASRALPATDPTRHRSARRVTVRMSDIAALAGVSLMTVSRAMHRPELVSAETLAKITKVVEGKGYVPDRIASSLSSMKSRAIGIVVPTLAHATFSETIQGISDVLAPMKYQLFVSATSFSMANEEEVVRSTLGRRPDAIVLTGFMHSATTRRMLVNAGIPVFEMWNLGRKAIDTVVGFSNKRAARDMTRYLIDKGHTRIGYIGGPTAENDRTTDREAGFREAMNEASIKTPPQAIVHEQLDYGGGKRGLAQLLAHYPRMQAVFAGAEMLAVGALSAALDRGLSVPKDMAIAGFDDSELSTLMRPSLTSIKLPRYQVGRQIAENLLARIAGTTKAPPSRIDAGYSLVVRESA